MICSRALARPPPATGGWLGAGQAPSGTGGWPWDDDEGGLLAQDDEGDLLAQEDGKDGRGSTRRDGRWRIQR